MNNLTFSQALEHLKAGARVARSGWHGKGLVLELQVPDEHSKMTIPYIYITVPDQTQTDGSFGDATVVPWFASQADLLTDDWYVVEVI